MCTKEYGETQYINLRHERRLVWITSGQLSQSEQQILSLFLRIDMWKWLSITQRVKRKAALWDKSVEERARHICIPALLLLIFISILLHLKHYIVSMEHSAERAHFSLVRGKIGFVSENNHNSSKWAPTRSCACMLWSMMETFRQHLGFQFAFIYFM